MSPPSAEVGFGQSAEFAVIFDGYGEAEFPLEDAGCVGVFPALFVEAG